MQILLRGTFKDYEVVVIFVRHKNKRLYGSAKTRDVFEMIGSGIEHGETPLNAAKRELHGNRQNGMDTIAKQHLNIDGNSTCLL